MAKPDPIETVRRIIAGKDANIDPSDYGLKTFKDDDSIEEADKKMGVVDAKSEEDPDLYQDAEGGHAKIDTDELEGGKEPKVPAKGAKKKTTKKSSAANTASIAGKAKGDKGNATVPATEHLEAIFDGEDLTEDFMTKVSTIFEAAINERVSAREAELQEEYESTLAEHLESVTVQLTEKIDDYLGYVVEEWVTDNKLALENGLRAEIAENFIQGLKGLFQDNYVDLPEEKVDLFTEVNEKNEQVETALNEQINNNIELKKSILEYRCNEILEYSCRDLVDTEAEKLRTLAEGIEFETEDQYQDKVSVLKESYFTGEVTESLEFDDTEEDLSEIKQELTEGRMGNYVDALSRTLK